VLVLLVGCGRLGFEAGPDAGAADVGGDGGAQVATPADASPDDVCTLGPFGPAVAVAELNSTGYDAEPSVSADGLTMYLSSSRGGIYLDLYVATRPEQDAPWTTPLRVAELADGAEPEFGPGLAADGRTLYYDSGYLSSTALAATRPTASGPWSAPSVVLGDTATFAAASDVDPSGDGLALYFDAFTIGDTVDVYRVARASRAVPFVASDAVPVVATAQYEGQPSVSGDELELYVVRAGPGGYAEIHVATRASVDVPFGPPVPLPISAGGEASEYGPELASDGRTLWFTSDRDAPDEGADEIYVTTRACL